MEYHYDRRDGGVTGLAVDFGPSDELWKLVKEAYKSLLAESLGTGPQAIRLPRTDTALNAESRLDAYLDIVSRLVQFGEASFEELLRDVARDAPSWVSACVESRITQEMLKELRKEADAVTGLEKGTVEYLKAFFSSGSTFKRQEGMKVELGLIARLEREGSVEVNFARAGEFPGCGIHLGTGQVWYHQPATVDM